MKRKMKWAMILGVVFLGIFAAVMTAYIVSGEGLTGQSDRVIMTFEARQTPEGTDTLGNWVEFTVPPSFTGVVIGKAPSSVSGYAPPETTPATEPPAQNGNAGSSSAQNTPSPPARSADGRLLAPPGSVGIVRGNCSDEQWNLALTYWSHIPEGWRNRFISDGQVMLITDDDFWTYFGYSSLAGMTNPSNKIIYIRASTNYLASTVAHEFGHFVDNTNGIPSRTSEFQTLLVTEGPYIQEYQSSGYAATNVREYFATIFCQIIEAPWTSVSAPQSFAYVMQYYNLYS